MMWCPPVEVGGMAIAWERVGGVRRGSVRHARDGSSAPSTLHAPDAPHVGDSIRAIWRAVVGRAAATGGRGRRAVGGGR